MNFIGVASKNVLRNKLRTLLTILGVSVAILAFMMLRTVLSAWTSAADYAAKDRIGTRHKVSFILPLPFKYKEDILNTPGVERVAIASWFGGKDPNRESEFFATIAVEPEDFLSVYDEVQVPEAQVEAWKEDRRGALIGDALAKQMGWKVGDNVTLRGTIYAGDWEFHISGIYTTARPSIDRSTLWFHWKYLNETLPANMKDRVGWFIARIDEPSRSAEISQTLDRKFETRDEQTLSMSERALNTSFLGMISAVLQAVNVVSVVILVIMMLILGNTIAMGVRERTNEYGMLRAIGFLPAHIGSFVLIEAAVIGLVGGMLGLALSYPLVERGMGRFLEENMGGFFPYFRIDPAVAGLGLLLALSLGILAAAIPAYQASKLNVVDSLRRIG